MLDWELPISLSLLLSGEVKWHNSCSTDGNKSSPLLFPAKGFANCRWPDSALSEIAPRRGGHRQVQRKEGSKKRKKRKREKTLFFLFASSQRKVQKKKTQTHPKKRGKERRGNMKENKTQINDLRLPGRPSFSPICFYRGQYILFIARSDLSQPCF